MPKPTDAILAALLEVERLLAAGVVKVKDRDSPQTVTLKARVGQRLVLDKMADQAEQGKAIRILVPKSRRHGISTIVQLVLFMLAALIDNWRSATVAHTKDAAGEIFEIAHRFNEHLRLAPDPSKFEIEFPMSQGKYVCRTALGSFTGSGGHKDALHVSEAAKMQQQAGGDATALASLISSVPQFSPSSIIVIESTGQGPSGDFYERCKMAEEGRGDYALCFLPWFADPVYQCDPPEDFQPTEYERGLIEAHGVTVRQLAWRRRLLESEYVGRELEFKWDYPSTLDECFASPAGLMYPVFSRERHVKTEIEAGLFGKRGDILLGIDFGGGASPFSVLWIKHYPALKPGLTMEPGCINAIREHMAWARDPKTDKPLDENKHLPDCLMYVVATCRLTGHVHVYREMYIVNAAVAGHTHLSLAMEILRRSKGETITTAICDRAEPLTINDLVGKGIPARPYVKLPGALGQGHIEQNAKRVLALMMGTEFFYDHSPSALETAQEKMNKKWPDGRDHRVPLTKREERALERRRAEEEFATFGGVEEV